MALLDYQTPQPPGRPGRLMPLLRFGAASAGVFVVLIGLATGFSHGKFDPCVPIAGCMIICPIWTLLLAFGLSIREHFGDTRMRERNVAVSLLGGAGLVIAFLGIVAMLDRLRDSQMQGLLMFAALLVLPIGCAWIVFCRSKFDRE